MRCLPVLVLKSQTTSVVTWASPRKRGPSWIREAWPAALTVAGSPKKFEASGVRPGHRTPRLARRRQRAVAATT